MADDGEEVELHGDEEEEYEDEEEEEVSVSKPASSAAAGSDANPADASSDLEAMKRRVQEMEEEAAKIEAAMMSQNQKTKPAIVNGPDVDNRSVHVGNVDYAVTPEELQTFFQSCGTINRITILCDKFSGHPKGFAYVEFNDTEGVANAMLLNESEFKGRTLKITPKRTNVPGFGKSRMRRRRRSFAPRFRHRNRRAVFQPY